MARDSIIPVTANLVVQQMTKSAEHINIEKGNEKNRNLIFLGDVCAAARENTKLSGVIAVHGFYLRVYVMIKTRFSLFARW